MIINIYNNRYDTDGVDIGTATFINNIRVYSNIFILKQTGNILVDKALGVTWSMLDLM